MHTVLFVFEFLGTTELLVVAVVALILFGPRKLPEIGRTVGKAIGEFKRASDDFKRTWEYEVELEQHNKPALDTATTASVPEASTDTGTEFVPAYGTEEIGGAASPPEDWETTVARGSADVDDGERPTEAHAARTGDDDEINAS
jgi:sec-independent protein translocase protein TatB